ncbi:CoA-binding protein [Qaidamihabitans albus]|uniref:CoA-binding protein n=1 Tax=Qaidamihabitans albus TaxID=2795733 RepID=UPI0018F17C49|nr:CoA-binding protein [Qaidamihabitans albus]
MDRHQRAESLRRVLAPESIAVVGASERNFYGRTVLENLARHRYDGVVIPVNPRVTTVRGLPCYPSLSEAPPADLVVVAVARDHFVDVVAEAASVGAAGLVALTSGLAETREPHWMEVEAKARAIADEAGMALLGPNGLGVISRACGAYAFGAPVPWEIGHGRTSLIMESGGLVCGSLAALSAYGAGLAHAASIGNGHAVGVSEWIEALADSAEVDQIGLMLEATPRWAGFSAAVRAARERGKTIYALKTGKSEAGARAAATHTGALAGDYATASGLLAQLGIQQVASMGGLLTALALHERFGSPAGTNLAVFAASGGAVGIIADAAADRDIELRPYAPATREAITGLAGILDPANPLDLGGQALSKPDEFATAVERVLGDPDVGAAVYVPSLGLPSGSLPDHQRLLELVASAAARAGKPVVVTQLTYSAVTSEVVEAHRHTDNVLACPNLEHSLDGLGPWLRTHPGAREPADKRPEPAPGGRSGQEPAVTALDEHRIKATLATHGIPVPRAVTYAPGDTPTALPFEAAVLKGMSPGVTHKSKAGLVALGVRSVERLRDAEAAMSQAAAGHGVPLPTLLLEELAPPGRDIFLSISEQPTGTIVTLGEGGTDVEERRNVGFLGWPATPAEIGRFVGQCVRGIDAAQREELIRLLDQLAGAYVAEGYTMLECNPVRIHDRGVRVLDAVALPAPAHRS